MHVIALDIGGTAAKVACFDDSFNSSCEAYLHINTTDVLSTGRIIDLLMPVLEKSKMVGNEVSGIGISIAGTVEKDGLIRKSLNTKLQDLDLAKQLESYFDLPVVIETDSVCGAIAEWRIGAGSGLDTFLYLSIGTGIGHAFLLQGSIWKGLDNGATAIGHLHCSEDGECSCGKYGCLAAHSSGGGLSRKTGYRYDGKEIEFLASQGDENCQNILEEGENKLALTLSYAYTLLDYTYTIIGGGAVSQEWPKIDRLTKKTEKYLFSIVRNVSIQKGRLGAKGPILGAAITIMNVLQQGEANVK